MSGTKNARTEAEKKLCIRAACIGEYLHFRHLKCMVITLIVEVRYRSLLSNHSANENFHPQHTCFLLDHFNFHK